MPEKKPSKRKQPKKLKEKRPSKFLEGLLNAPCWPGESWRDTMWRNSRPTERQ